MECLRVTIKSWTASFRYPIFMIGYQPSLPMPPLSTIWGLLSAVKGDYLTSKDFRCGYLFFSHGKAVDLESLYELQENRNYKINVCKREILYDNELLLYIDALELESNFRKPYYPILLGRSTDIAEITEIKQVTLRKNSAPMRAGRTIVPFPCQQFGGILQALPQYFTNTVPREAVGTRPYQLVDEIVDYRGDDFLYDEEKDWGVYMHEKTQ